MNPLDKLFAALGIVVAMFLAGVFVERSHEEPKLTALKTTYANNLQRATDALTAANALNTRLQNKAANAVAHASTTYDKEKADAKPHDEAVIAGLRSELVRLRVRTNRPACSAQLPGASASPGVDNGPAPETLAGSVAARLARRYADYNAIVRQLDACQAVVAADRLINP